MKALIDRLTSWPLTLSGRDITSGLRGTLEAAKEYLRDRYEGDLDARFGIVASSRDSHCISSESTTTFSRQSKFDTDPGSGRGMTIHSVVLAAHYELA